MLIPSTPRRTGARSKPVHFTYVGVERGQPTEAYIAGPTWWGWLHMSRPSKPCVYELTGGKIACRFCGEGKRRVAVVKGWVPLYRRLDGLAWMVPVDECQRDTVDALKCFAKVMVGRGKGKGVGVWVQPCVSQEPVWTSTLPERTKPADVSASLITVWALPEVTNFFCGPSDTTLSLPQAPGRERIEGTNEGRGEELADVKPYTAPDPLAANEAFVDSVNRAKNRLKPYEPSANGRHDKK